METNRKITLVVAFGLPVIYALVLRILYGMEHMNETFNIMSVTFILVLPIITGFLTVYLSSVDAARRYSYRILAPWIPIFVFLVITLVLALEGWACWIMVMPVFMVGATLGGLLGGYIRVHQSKNTGQLSMSVLVLLPFLISPLEATIERIPGVYQAYTYIDIEAPAEAIWSNVTRVPEIPAEQDTGRLTRALGFPRPVVAELDFEGVGAYRAAVFTGGLVFHEVVTEYEHEKKMTFSITAIPHEIPSTTLDEHVVVGGEFFDVLDGTYELETLANGRYRLHLYSHFEMNTTFNFYAGLWGKWIMKDIQNNILRVIKSRAEAG